ncbi:hypothetical protein PAMP_021579 [Pampus punctatissimus]
MQYHFLCRCHGASGHITVMQRRDAEGLEQRLEGPRGIHPACRGSGDDVSRLWRTDYSVARSAGKGGLTIGGRGT